MLQSLCFIVIFTKVLTDAYQIQISEDGRLASIFELEANNSRCENCNGSEHFAGIVEVTVTSPKVDHDLHVIPAWIFHSFENLEALGVSEQYNLSFISTNQEKTFQSAKQLRKLDFAHQNIISLDENSFEGAFSLEEINLSYNYIEFVHEYSLSKLKNLSQIDMAYNSIVFLTKETFCYNSKLKKIVLSWNQLKILDPDMFYRNPELEYIYLNGNHLRGHVRLQFDVYNVEYLSMYSNQIENLTIEKHSCGSRNGFEFKYFYDNQLTNYSLCSCREKVYLDFGMNALEDVGILEDPLSVAILWYSHNPLGDVKKLSALRSVEYLYLNNASLEKFAEHIFEPFESLKILSLSENNLGNFDLELLRPLRNLERLDIDEIGRTSIDFLQLQEMFPSLTYLSLYGNPLNCESTKQYLSGEFPFLIYYNGPSEEEACTENVTQPCNCEELSEYMNRKLHMLALDFQYFNFDVNEQLNVLYNMCDVKCPNTITKKEEVSLGSLKIKPKGRSEHIAEIKTENKKLTILEELNPFVKPLTETISCCEELDETMSNQLHRLALDLQYSNFDINDRLNELYVICARTCPEHRKKNNADETAFNIFNRLLKSGRKNEELKTSLNDIRSSRSISTATCCEDLEKNFDNKLHMLSLDFQYFNFDVNDRLDELYSLASGYSS